MAKNNNPKLEFFRFSINHKSDKHKTFKDFAIEVLGVDKNTPNAEIFKRLFVHFMNAPEKGFEINEQMKKVLTWINDKTKNVHYDKKPSFNTSSYVINGVLNAGSYSEDSILSDITNKNNSQKLERNNSILKYYYIFLYFPVDYTEGFIMVHSDNSENSITNLLRDYVAKLFKQGDYKKPIVTKFCPKQFQDEFRKGATISSLNFKTTFLNDIPSNDPVLYDMDGYDVSITITPKKQTLDFGNLGNKLMDFFAKGTFKGYEQTKNLKDFNKMKVGTRNVKTKSSNTFEWNKKDKEFTPVVYLDNRVKMTNNNTPDFDDLKNYCNKLFKEQILPELRPDLQMEYVD